MREKRLTYLALSKEAEAELCTFCKFAGFSGGSVCSDDVYSECEHKLKDLLPAADGMEPGRDCWAFRPRHPIEVVADIVGLLLGNEGRGASWIKREDGTYAVYVVKDD